MRVSLPGGWRPRRLQSDGDAQLAAKTFTVPAQQAEARALGTLRRVAHSHDHFIERAIAAGGDDDSSLR